MADLINRDAVLLDINEEIETNQEYPEDKLVRKGLRIARKCIENAPIIEVESVRHGRWIQCDALDYIDPNGVIHVHGMCSCCRLIYDFRDMTSRFKFCPNCGAKMTGGVDNANS